MDIQAHRIEQCLRDACYSAFQVVDLTKDFWKAVHTSDKPKASKSAPRSRRRSHNIVSEEESGDEETYKVSAAESMCVHNNYMRSEYVLHAIVKCNLACVWMCVCVHVFTAHVYSVCLDVCVYIVDIHSH